MALDHLCSTLVRDLEDIEITIGNGRAALAAEVAIYLF